MGKANYLPLGSVVTLKGGVQKIIIIGRGMNVEDEGESYFYDYVAVPYPVGMTGDKVVYFNHDSVELVLFIGYDDDDNQIMNSVIQQYVEDNQSLRRK